MSDTPDTEADAPPEDELAQEDVDRLRDFIQQEIDKKLHKINGGRARRDHDDIDIESQVAKAVEAARDKDKQTAAQKARDAKIKELEDKLASKEKAPREYKKIHSFMGWVTDADE